MTTVRSPFESTQLARRVLVVHIDGFSAEVDIPDGWMLAKGKTRMGDRYLHDYQLQKGIVQWEDVEPKHLLEKWGSDTNYYQWASAFSCLIRPVKTDKQRQDEAAQRNWEAKVAAINEHYGNR